MLQIQIVRRDRSMERVIFPIPEICSYLTQETKQNIVINTERDAQVKAQNLSAITHFDLYNNLRF